MVITPILKGKKYDRYLFKRYGKHRTLYQKAAFLLDKTAQAVPMEQKDAVHLLSQHDFIVFAYPVQFSNVPIMVKDFIKNHPESRQKD